MTLANSHLQGYCSCAKDKFIDLVKNWYSPSEHNLIILFPIPSHPHAMEVLTFCNKVKTSVSVARH